MAGGSEASRGHVLPTLLTRFFGRTTETRELVTLLEDTRLVTLVGAPGSGKTRLGIELASRMATKLGVGAYLAELAPISDAGLVADVLATSIGLDESPGSSIEDTLVARLADAELVVVLDNCEHVAEAAGRLARRLAERCPGVRLVAASRVPLRVAGEQVWNVPPLEGDASIELFCDRAMLANGSFEIDEPGKRLVSEICGRLDRLPLAIELIAAWARVLTLNEIIDRLGAALPLLREVAHATSPHHKTMQASVEWSCRLLDPASQLLFERASVFAGGFDLAGLQAVAATEGDVLPTLTSLVDHSLILAEQPSGATMRYRQLEPVRQCGQARLESRGDTDDIRWRHAHHYLEVACQCDLELHGNQRSAALHLFEQEYGNFLQALSWCRAQRTDIGLQLAVAMTNGWALQSQINEGRAWLENFLELDTSDRSLRATATARVARMAWRQRDYDAARAWYDEALKLQDELGDDFAVAQLTGDQALVRLSMGELTAAQQLSLQCIDKFRALGQDDDVVWALFFLGIARYLADDRPAGDEILQEGLAISRRSDNAMATVYILLGLIYPVVDLGMKPAAARAYAVEALSVLERVTADQVMSPDHLWGFCALAAVEGRPRAALRLAGAASIRGRRGGSYTPDLLTHQVHQLVNEARKIVGATRADGLMAEGEQLSLPEIKALVLADADADDADVDPPLSPRETEVAHLVGKGLANTEIAQELFISRRTVESHVEHIKQKLGFRSRHQIMAWALRESPEPANP